MAPERISVITRADSLSQQAYTAIRDAIRNGLLIHGEFYSEGELAKSMEISRTPVREALIELNREGLIEVLPQRGFRLRELEAADRREVFELRAVLETYVVTRLAETATAANISELRALLDRQTASLDDPVAFLEIDEQFHLLMPRLVDLKLTYQMLFTLRGALWLMATSALTVPERGASVVEEHRAVVDAIESGDAEGAVAAMRRHIHETSHAVQESEGLTEGEHGS